MIMDLIVGDSLYDVIKEQQYNYNEQKAKKILRQVSNFEYFQDYY